MHRSKLGAAGEAIVAASYERDGYRVRARNWRVPEGELDLVLERGRTLVFCEVKTRSGRAYGAGVEAVTAEKTRRIRRLALLYCRIMHVHGRDIRFDVAGVVWDRGRPKIERYEDAF